jgi:hypothetical protein
MRPFNAASKTNHKIVAIVLMMALLCAQWAGQLHRIGHADGLQGFSSTHQTSDWLHLARTAVSGTDRTFASMVDDGHDHARHDTNHSCTLFDAAALASSVHTTPFELPPVPNVRVLALWTAFISWQAPFACHFSSRAPPHA